MPISKKETIWLITIILISVLLLFFDFPFLWNNLAPKLKLPPWPAPISFPYHLGLDLEGGTILTYKADISNLTPSEVNEALIGAKDLIERRVNILGVSEPKITVAQQSGQETVIVELAGIRDVNQAIQEIGQTPFLEFKEIRPEAERDQILKKYLNKDEFKKLKDGICSSGQIIAAFINTYNQDPCFKETPLTGKYLERATPAISGIEPIVQLQFNGEGAKIFEDLTSRNIGKPLAIYLDRLPLSLPIVQQTISGGQAQISGSFTIDTAKDLARNLNEGALPVPIDLISQTTIGASLGKGALDLTVRAGIIGFLLIILFMIVYYRFAGVFASLALIIYVILSLAVFKFFGIANLMTLTLSGIAGFILSVGMAVDANILIFERTREELRINQNISQSLDHGFSRAWPSIRDSNLNTILAAASLFFLTSSFIKGFAWTLGLGVVISMFTAITVTRIFLKRFINLFLKDLRAFLPK